MSISLTSVILVCSLSFSLRCKSSFSGSTAGAACWLLLLCSSSTIEQCHHVVLLEPAMARCSTTAVTTYQQYGKNSYCIHKLLVVLIKQTCHRPYRTYLQEWPVFPLNTWRCTAMFSNKSYQKIPLLTIQKCLLIAITQKCLFIQSSCYDHTSQCKKRALTIAGLSVIKTESDNTHFCHPITRTT